MRDNLVDIGGLKFIIVLLIWGNIALIGALYSILMLNYQIDIGYILVGLFLIIDIIMLHDIIQFKRRKEVIK